MAEKDNRPKKINYVTRENRSDLLQLCKSERDRLIVRMGFEVGLRTSENTGLILSDFKAKRSSHCGLLGLFSELDKNPTKQSFEYILSGKYTKGNRTRNIYFSNELLAAMKRYYEEERSLIEGLSSENCDTLFIRMDNGGAGLPIGKGYASDLFRKLSEDIPYINSCLSYHDLRHTFATELYHAELLNESGHETRSESAALMVVSERLGHKSVTSTRQYIRLKQQMLIIEGEV